MSKNILAISPIDGRYKKVTLALQQYFSEYSLFKYRLKIEIEYFILLCDTIPELFSFPKEKFDILRKLYINFSTKDCSKIKNIEKKTKHDIKALEYFIQEKFLILNIGDYKSFIHFGLT